MQIINICNLSKKCIILKKDRIKLNLSNEDRKYKCKPLEFQVENSDTQSKKDNIFTEELSPYQKALEREKERKSKLFLKKKECMTQRGMKNFKNSVQSFHATYNLGKLSSAFHQNQLREKEVVNFEQRLMTQKQFLTIKGQKKSIEVDSAFLDAKRKYLEKQDQMPIKMKSSKRNNSRILHEISTKVITSKKDLEEHDLSTSYGKSFISSKKASRKPKLRNNHLNTFECSSKNEEADNITKEMRISKFHRLRTENNHSRKVSRIEK